MLSSVGRAWPLALTAEAMQIFLEEERIGPPFWMEPQKPPSTHRCKHE